MRTWKEWGKAALIRALRTFAQTAVGCITVGAAMDEVQWLRAFSIAAVAFILSLLTSLGGLPEVDDQEPEPITPMIKPPDQEEE